MSACHEPHASVKYICTTVFRGVTRLGVWITWGLAPTSQSSSKNRVTRCSSVDLCFLVCVRMKTTQERSDMWGSDNWGSTVPVVKHTYIQIPIAITSGKHGCPYNVTWYRNPGNWAWSLPVMPLWSYRSKSIASWLYDNFHRLYNELDLRVFQILHPWREPRLHNILLILVNKQPQFT